MDNSAEMKRMLEAAMTAHPESFKDFDTTKNVQDQLQEMVCSSVDEIMWMPTMFYWGEQDWYHVDEYASQFKTAEQMWLAYVMKDKYGKTWNGQDWVKG